MFSNFFDLLATINGKHFPINRDRIEKFSTTTHYFAEKFRDMDYEQKYSPEEELGKTAE